MLSQVVGLDLGRGLELNAFEISAYVLHLSTRMKDMNTVRDGCHYGVLYMISPP